MRDFLDAIHSRVVLFDGGMGATLEQFDLTQEDYGGLQGQWPEARTLGKFLFGELVEIVAEQAEGLVNGGAALLIIETAQDILEVKAAVFGAREAFKKLGKALPIQTSVSLLPQGGKMLLGTDIAAVLPTLSPLDVQVIGLNCSTGPPDMRDAHRVL